MWYFWVETYIVFSKLFSATNQKLFCVTESDIRQGPSNHTSPLYELLVSVLWLTLSFGEVSKTCIILGDTVDILTSDRNLVFLFVYFVFPALIDIPSNFEINRLIRFVVSGIFLLPCSASLMSFSSFLSHF